MNLRFITILSWFTLLVNPIELRAAYDLNYWMQKDTIKISRDSLLKIIQVKDSMLLQASLDSLATNNLLEVIWWEKDSIQQELQNVYYVMKLDSLYQRRHDSLLIEFNRDARWRIRDSLHLVEQDSVRSSLGVLLDASLQDSAKNPDHRLLVSHWNNLIYHLANDSTFFWIHYGQGDSVSVILKDNQEVRSAIFLTNQQADSAKVYLKGAGKHSLHMWVDENLFLTHVLKRNDGLDSIAAPKKLVSMIDIPKRKLPAGLPKYWKTDGKVDLTLSQFAYSNWANGADNQFTFLLESKGAANYAKDRMTWNNDYWYRLGAVKLEGREIHKNVDALRARSNFSHKAFSNFNYNASTQFDGQLFLGYRTAGDSIPYSKFLAPATIRIGAGMVYTPKKGISVSLQPASGLFKLVVDTVKIDPTKHGLAGDQWIKGQPGATLTIDFKEVLWKTINTHSTLILFSNYGTALKKLDDIDWTTTLSLKVNKYISTKFFIKIKYDEDAIIPVYKWIDGVKTKIDEGKRVQIQENFGITFTYHL